MKANTEKVATARLQRLPQRLAHRRCTYFCDLKVSNVSLDDPARVARSKSYIEVTKTFAPDLLHCDMAVAICLAPVAPRGWPKAMALHTAVSRILPMSWQMNVKHNLPANRIDLFIRKL